MKKVLLKYIILLGICTLFSTPSLMSQQETINWLSWEEAMKASEEEPKKIFVDVYTDWCGYCKKMDATTFTDAELINKLNENFYAVKFNAEQKEEITYNDFTYKFVKGGKRGYHQLAQSLLDGRLGYPSFVLLDEEKTKILLSPGYKSPEKVMIELEYALQEQYKVQSFSKYKKSLRE